MARDADGAGIPRRPKTKSANKVNHVRLNVVNITRVGTMSRQQSLQRGSALMVLGALIFLAYAVVFFLLALSSSGFEIGVATLNGVTTQQLNGINPAIMGYITHLHLATAGFIAATAIAAGGLAWYGVRDGLWWAWITAVISPVLGLAVALPMHWMGHFSYDWVSHVGPIYLGTIIYVVGVVVALIGLSQAAPTVATPSGRIL
jgi:hypothetical protein